MDAISLRFTDPAGKARGSQAPTIERCEMRSKAAPNLRQGRFARPGRSEPNYRSIIGLRPSHGFTLTELLVVIAVIGTLSALTLVAAHKISKDARLALGTNTVVAELTTGRISQPTATSLQAVQFDTQPARSTARRRKQYCRLFFKVVPTSLSNK